MSVRGIWLNGKHSYRDFGMYLLQQPEVGYPDARTVYIDVPGANGKLDYTEAVANRVTYRNRTVVYTFGVMCEESRQGEFISDVMSFLHGQTVEAVDDKDPDWMFTGRAVVDISERTSWRMNVRVTIDAYPFKLSRDETSLYFDEDSVAEERFEVGTNSLPSYWAQTKFFFEKQSGSSPVPVPHTVLDARNYTSLIVTWSPSATHDETATPYITIASTGVSGGTVVSISSFNDLQKTMTIASLTTAGVNVNSIELIHIHGIGGCKLTAVCSGVGHALIQNGAMPVVPRWIVATANSVPCILNGVQFSLPSGDNKIASMELQPGENELTLFVDTGETVEMRFRRGML